MCQAQPIAKHIVTNKIILINSLIVFVLKMWFFSEQYKLFVVKIVNFFVIILIGSDNALNYPYSIDLIILGY